MFTREEKDILKGLIVLEKEEIEEIIKKSDESDKKELRKYIKKLDIILKKISVENRQ